MLYAAPLKPLAKLPEKVDLRKSCPTIYNKATRQLHRHAIAAASSSTR